MGKKASKRAMSVSNKVKWGSTTDLKASMRVKLGNNWASLENSEMMWENKHYRENIYLSRHPKMMGLTTGRGTWASRSVRLVNSRL